MPPLKRRDGTWAKTGEEKAELLLETLTAKYNLPAPEANRFTGLAPTPPQKTADFLVVRSRHARKVLKNLKEDKATGPDLVASKLLKSCASELGVVVAKLGRLLLDSGHWPQVWRTHWVFPLYKRKAVHDPGNYRGIHLSSQVSKVLERLLGRFFLPLLEAEGAFGPNQFAYRQKRGCKDALAHNVLQWLWWIHSGKKVGLYCSDVSGAFDRVPTERLLQKLKTHGVGGKLLALLGSWLDTREAVVVVDGAKSVRVCLRNMVYQGSVWGPALWNLYFSDSRAAVQQAGFDDTYFADDQCCYRDFAGRSHNTTITEDLEHCQQNLHAWGAANQVLFDSSKESLHVLHKRRPEGEAFKGLGVLWDTKLKMEAEVHDVAVRANWKLSTLLRAKRFFNTDALVCMYKSQVLPTLEFPTPAVYHCSATTLDELDKVQKRFLRAVDLTAEDALLLCNLAPLQTRRDMATLGLIHRTVLGEGAEHFQKWFFRDTRPGHRYSTRLQDNKHNKQLYDYLDGTHSELLRRSALGLTRTYNSLDQETVNAKTVPAFQRALQKALKNKVRRGEPNWENAYNCRKERARYT